VLLLLGAPAGEELSDCLLYLTRLADVCGVDLGAAVAAKLQVVVLPTIVINCRAGSSGALLHACFDVLLVCEPHLLL
jgi:hypothetical protein